MENLKVVELFKGYGSQSCSLTDCNIPHEVVATSEIDADAIIAYAAIRFDREDLIKKPDGISDEEVAKWLIDRNIGYDFKNNRSKVATWLKKKDKTYLYTVYNSAVLGKELGDVGLINAEDVPDHDLLTYSFPCTTVSVAGKMEGLAKGSGTTSSLLWECQKIIQHKKPKYLLMENVKNLVGKQFKPFFDEWCEWLKKQGYTNTYKVINGKDYGVPQNRERVFMVSILAESGDKFEFAPTPCIPVKLKDVLETEVDEKYHINKPFTFINKPESNSICNQVANLDIKGNDCIRRVYRDDKCCPTLSTMQGGMREPKILEENKIIHIANTNDKFESNARVYLEDGLSPTLAARDYKDAKKIMVESLTERETVCEERSDEGIRFFKDNICGTIRTINSGGDKRIIERSDLEETYKIRKLTPLECWRLMGMSDERFYRVKNMGISDSQLYKLAGNSIIVNCLNSIFEELFKEYMK